MKKIVSIVRGIWVIVIGVCLFLFVTSLIFDFLVWIGVDSLVRIDMAMNKYALSKWSLILPLDFVDFWKWSNFWEMCLTVAFSIPFIVGVALIKSFSELENEQIRFFIAFPFFAALVAQIVLVSVGYWEAPTIIKYINLTVALNTSNLDMYLNVIDNT